MSGHSEVTWLACKQTQQCNPKANIFKSVELGISTGGSFPDLSPRRVLHCCSYACQNLKTIVLHFSKLISFVPALTTAFIPCAVFHPRGPRFGSFVVG